jgi:hypothetical protein
LAVYVVINAKVLAQGTSDNDIMAALIELVCNLGEVLIRLSTFGYAKQRVKSNQTDSINVNNRNQTVLTYSVESVLA